MQYKPVKSLPTASGSTFTRSALRLSTYTKLELKPTTSQRRGKLRQHEAMALHRILLAVLHRCFWDNSISLLRLTGSLTRAASCLFARELMQSVSETFVWHVAVYKYRAIYAIALPTSTREKERKKIHISHHPTDLYPHPWKRYIHMFAVVP